jgi:hypothetical protein
VKKEMIQNLVNKSGDVKRRTVKFCSGEKTVTGRCLLPLSVSAIVTNPRPGRSKEMLHTVQ